MVRLNKNIILNGLLIIGKASKTVLVKQRRYDPAMNLLASKFLSKLLSSNLVTTLGEMGEVVNLLLQQMLCFATLV